MKEEFKIKEEPPDEKPRVLSQYELTGLVEGRNIPAVVGFKNGPTYLKFTRIVYVFNEGLEEVLKWYQKGQVTVLEHGEIYPNVLEKENPRIHKTLYIPLNQQKKAERFELI